METLNLSSYAKINLGLLVLSKRRDGYHNIITLFQQIDLCDQIEFSRISGKIKISSDNADVPVGKKNFIYKAFSLFKNKTGIKGGIRIRINKRIPLGGGLGGGSSNAAVALLALNKLWNYPLNKNDLTAIAEKIGADVPFFIDGGAAIGRGKGEILEKIVYPNDWWIVLVCPDIFISTAWVYNQSKIILTKEKKITNFKPFFENFDSSALEASIYNEFEDIVFPRYPSLEEIKVQLKRMGAFYASMSGSGSSVYGFFFDKERAIEIKEFFSMEKGIKSFLCRPLSLDASKNNIFFENNFLEV